MKDKMRWENERANERERERERKKWRKRWIGAGRVKRMHVPEGCSILRRIQYVGNFKKRGNDGNAVKPFSGIGWDFPWRKCSFVDCSKLTSAVNRLKSMHPDGSTFAIRAACAATLIELGQILRCTVVYLRDVRRSLELSFVSCRKTASKIKKKEKASGEKEGVREKKKGKSS